MAGPSEEQRAEKGGGDSKPTQREDALEDLLRGESFPPPERSAETHVSIPSEHYRGQREDREFIKSWLAGKRAEASTAEYIEERFAEHSGGRSRAEIEVVGSVAELLRSPEKSAYLGFDAELFKSITSAALEQLEKISPAVKAIDPERYWVAKVKPESEGDGGFHSEFAHGYRYVEHYSASVALSDKLTDSTELRTLELARNYLHDCLHCSTARSFRIMPTELRAEKPEWPIYRHQYGLNFRQPNGMSYSPAKSPDAPRSMNLNVLMDGLVVLKVAEVLEQVYPVKGLSENAKGVVADEIYHPSKAEQFSATSTDFANEVPIASQAFLDYWGGQPFQELLLGAMFSGTMKEVLPFFGTQARERSQSDPEFSAQLQRNAQRHGEDAQKKLERPTDANLWNLNFLSPDFHRMS